MRKLPRPTVPVSDVLKATAKHCYSRRRAMLEDPRVESTLVRAEDVYDQNMLSGSADLVATSTNIAGIINSGDAQQVYDDLGKTKVDGMSVRDRLRNADGNEKCAYCGLDRSNTLDHYLPKSEYVEYAFTPINLVPSCSICNSSLKRGSVPASSSEVLFHPYYDEPNDAQWLMVDVEVREGVGLLPFYSVQKPSTWTDAKFLRIKNAFECFGLADAYAKDFLVKLSECKGFISTLYYTCGAVGLQSHFASMEVMNQTPNNWIQIGYGYLANHLGVCEQFPQWFM